MEGDLKRNETVSPMSGKTPSQEMPVDVTRLEREYFEHVPDVEDPTQLVSFGSVSKAQEIVNDALKSFDSAYQQREVR
jgi:hypothetical protein